MSVSSKFRFHLTFSAAILAGAMAHSGCKSEVDGKPKAEVADVKDKAKDKADDKDKAKAEPAADAAKAGKALALDGTKSKVGFVGAKVTGDHKGEFRQLAGKLEASDGKPSLLEVEVDTASVQSDAEKLTGHLKSPDFFDVEKFPKAKFVAKTFAEAATGGATHTVTGELELHGVKKEVSFPAAIEINASGASGKAEFTINRKDFGIVYAGKADDLIKDDVLLKLDLVFS